MITKCPNRIAVFGGGRWARVFVEVLCGILPRSVTLSVHSPHNADSISNWLSERGWGHWIKTAAEYPDPHSDGLGAVIVANSARDHERVAQWALAANVPVLVEKPIALTGSGAMRLVELARNHNTRLAAAHVFLFARYIERFADQVRHAGNVHSIKVRWTDPRLEYRHGGMKSYDPSIPVFSDWLPHVMSIIGTFSLNRPRECELRGFARGGARLEFHMMLGDVSCNVELERNSDKRCRLIEVTTEQHLLMLDFSKEPGVIRFDSTTIAADPEWRSGPRPVERMLTAFLEWASGGEGDTRLNVDVGLNACRLIDEAANEYRAVLLPWLGNALSSGLPNDEDLNYSLSELLTKDYLSSTLVHQMIERVRGKFLGRRREYWLSKLSQVTDPEALLTSLAVRRSLSKPPHPTSLA